MKNKTVRNFLASALLLAAGFSFIPQQVEARIQKPKVFDKESIDCGAYFGTKCVGDGDGCDPTACKSE